MSNSEEEDDGGGLNQGPEVVEEREAVEAERGGVQELVEEEEGWKDGDDGDDGEDGEDGDDGFREALESWEAEGDEVEESLMLEEPHQESGGDGGQRWLEEMNTEEDGYQEGIPDRETGEIEIQEMMEKLQETNGQDEEVIMGAVDEPEDERDLFSQMVEAAAGYELEEGMDELEPEGDGTQEMVEEQEAGGSSVPQQNLEDWTDLDIVYTEENPDVDIVKEEVLEWEVGGDESRERVEEEQETRAVGVLCSVKEETVEWEAEGDGSQEADDVQCTGADRALDVVKEEIVEGMAGGEVEAAGQSSQQQEMDPPVNGHLASPAAMARTVKKGKGRRYGKPITEKWRPVYVWLGTLNPKEVVKFSDIQDWLNEHSDIKQRLTQSHSMDHIFNYIQKCHARLITDPKDRKPTLKINQPERREAPTVLREVRLKRALKKVTLSTSEQVNGGGVRSQQPGHQGQGGHMGRGRKRKRWGMGTTQRPRSVATRLGRFGPSGTRGRRLLEKGKEPAIELPGIEGSSSLHNSYVDMDQGTALKRYELLAALRDELVDLLGNFKELAREKLPGMDNGPDSSLFSQPGSSSRESGKGPAAVFAWSFSEALPGGDPAVSLGEGRSVHPEKGDAKMDISTALDKMTRSILKCLSEREQGGHSATGAFRPSEIGSHGREWTSYVRGWNSLGSQFNGPVNWLQRQDYSSWSASWCAYTSSVALAPLGGVDQGVQKVLDLRLHPGGLPQLVCSCNAAPNELLLYNLASGRARELAGHNCQIQAVEYALNGDLIVSCGTNILKVWDSASGTCLYTMGPRENDGAPGHKKKISAMAVHQSQSCLVATSGGEGESDILIWNVRTGELASDLNLQIRQRRSNLQSMDALQFCHENLLICGSDSSGNQPAVVQIWDVDAGKDLLTVPACDSYITCLSTDPRGCTVITGAGDGTVGLFDIRGGGAIARLPLGLNTEATSVAFSACGRYFHSSCSANHTLVWDTRMISMDPGPVPKERPVTVSKLDARATRPLHCLSHGDPMPTTQNAGQLPGFVDEGDGGVNDARWCRLAPVLVTASGNGSVAIWDVALGQPCLRQLSSHSRCINTVAISPNDQLICSGGDDQKVVLYHNSKAESTQGWKLTHPMRAELQAVAVSEQQ